MIKVNEGTAKNIATDIVRTTEYGVVKLDIGAAGASSLFTGTLPGVANLSKGTITELEGGTVDLITRVGNVGTLEAGTVTVTNPTGTTVQFNNGTVDLIKAGTISKVEGGSIVVTAGTVTTTLAMNNGTIDLLKSGTITKLEGGTLGLVTRVGNVGTLELGTVTLTNPTGTVVTVDHGTVTLSNPTGTTVTVDHGTITLSNPTGTTVQFNNGTVDLLKAGTITTLPNIPGGTLGLVTRVGNVGTLEVGTISTLPNIPGGTLGLVSSLSNGSIRVTTGTITTGNSGTDPTIFIPTRLTDGTNFYTATGAGGGGTTVTVDHGSIVVTAGTVSTNVVMSDIPGGTLGLVTRVGNIGTLEVGTVTLTNPTGTTVQFNNGTVNLVGAGAITRLEGGTLGLITRVGNVGTLEVGTISTLPNLPGGTVNLITRVGNVGTLEVGTISTMPNIPGGTIGVVTTVSNISNGTIRVTVGTISAGTINTGTVNAGTINTGTINAGTINAGTIRNDGRPARNILTYGTTMSGAGAAYATLVGSAAVGVGTSTWVESISISNPNANLTCLVGFGTALNGTSVLLKGTYGTTSAVGIMKAFPDATNAGMTNQDLVAYISGAGTIDVNVSYFISA